MPYEIKVLGPGDERILHNVADEVFDHAVDPQATKEFLADPRHHLVVAIQDGVVIGMATGVHYIHPDKPVPQLWVNEAGVAPSHRGRGVGKALMRALFDVGRAHGCAEAWLGTERDNVAAMRLYASIGGTAVPDDTVMFTFRLES